MGCAVNDLLKHLLGQRAHLIDKMVNSHMRGCTVDGWLPLLAQTARSSGFPRALVCLRDGLTADSTRRTIPELKRAAEVWHHSDDPDHPPGPRRPGNGYLQI